VEIRISTDREDHKQFLEEKYILKDLWNIRTQFKEELEYKLNKI